MKTPSIKAVQDGGYDAVVHQKQSSAGKGKERPVDTAKAEIDSMKRRLIILPFGAAVLHSMGHMDGLASPDFFHGNGNAITFASLPSSCWHAGGHRRNENSEWGFKTCSKALPTWIPSSPSALPPPLSTVCMPFIRSATAWPWGHGFGPPVQHGPVFLSRQL